MGCVNSVLGKSEPELTNINVEAPKDLGAGKDTTNADRRIDLMFP